MRPKEFLPPQWAASDPVAAFHAANEKQLEKLFAALNETLDQMSPQTATWALEEWERAYGIPSDDGKTVEFRRDQLLAKLRGRGTSTVELVRDVAASYLGADVEVVEYPAEHRIEVWTAESMPDDERVDAYRSILTEILPAHLGCNVVTDYKTVYVETMYHVEGQPDVVYPAFGEMVICDLLDEPVWSAPSPEDPSRAVATLRIRRHGQAAGSCTIRTGSALNVHNTAVLTVDLSGGPEVHRITGVYDAGPWLIESDREDVYLVNAFAHLPGHWGYEAWGIGAGGGCDGSFLITDMKAGNAYWTTAAFGGGGSGYTAKVESVPTGKLFTAKIGAGGKKGVDGGDTTLTAKDGGTLLEARGGRAAKISYINETPVSEKNHNNNIIVVDGGDGSNGGGAAAARGYNWRTCGPAGVDGQDGTDTEVDSSGDYQGLGGKGQGTAIPPPSFLECGKAGSGAVCVGIDPDALIGGESGNASNVMIQWGDGAGSRDGYGDGGFAWFAVPHDIPTHTLTDGKAGVICISVR